MATQLVPSGWKYFVVDIQWYEADTKGHAYKEGAPVTMDEYSRPVPAPQKFPSAANGQGFKPLADYVHSKGLKFGIHITSPRTIHDTSCRTNGSATGKCKTLEPVSKPADGSWLRVNLAADK